MLGAVTDARGLLAVTYREHGPVVRRMLAAEQLGILPFSARLESGESDALIGDHRPARVDRGWRLGSRYVGAPHPADPIMHALGHAETDTLAVADVLPRRPPRFDESCTFQHRVETLCASSEHVHSLRIRRVGPIPGADRVQLVWHNVHPPIPILVGSAGERLGTALLAFAQTVP